MHEVNKLGVSEVRTVLRKFSDEAKTDLLEVIVAENGVRIDQWKKGDSRPPPED